MEWYKYEWNAAKSKFKAHHVVGHAFQLLSAPLLFNSATSSHMVCHGPAKATASFSLLQISPKHVVYHEVISAAIYTGKVLEYSYASGW